MTSPIALSLAGRGRVVLLEPKTVRQAYFRFQAANQLTARQVHRFNLPRPRGKPYTLTVLDRLLRRVPFFDRGGAIYLAPAEIARIEREMNRMLLAEDAVLVRGEGIVDRGYVPSSGGRGSMRKVLYVVRYGLIFEIEPLTRETLFRGSARDLVLEGHDRRVRLLRYEGLATPRAQTGVEVRFRDRFDLSRAWSVSLSDFAPRRLFAIGNVATFDGFHIREW
jgi:hypothetical protein